jgi:hypothetical protein
MQTWTKEQLLRISPAVLRARLLEVGWQSAKKTGYWKSPDGRLFYLPEEPEDSLDFASLDLLLKHLMAMEQVITFGDLEGRVLKKVRDILYFGVELDGVAPGRLPLAMSPYFYSASLKYVKHAAKVATDELKKSSAIDVLKHASAAETVAGSYLVAIHFSAEATPDSATRKTVEVAIDGIWFLQNVISGKPVRGIGPSAEMCDALVQLIDKVKASEIKMRASFDLSARPRVNAHGEVALSTAGGAVDSISDYAAGILGVKPGEIVTVVGIPYASEDRAIIGEGERRTVKVLWKRDGRPNMKVTLILDYDEYMQAKEALSARHIEVKGYLRQNKTRWYLEPLSKPTLFDDAPSEKDLEEISLDKLD